MSGEQEYFCPKCGYEWETLDPFTGCPECRRAQTATHPVSDAATPVSDEMLSIGRTWNAIPKYVWENTKDKIQAIERQRNAALASVARLEARVLELEGVVDLNQVLRQKAEAERDEVKVQITEMQEKLQKWKEAYTNEYNIGMGLVKDLRETDNALSTSRAECEKLREALSVARDWIVSNTTKPVHELLNALDAAWKPTNT